MKGLTNLALAVLVITLMALAPDNPTSDVVSLEVADFTMDIGPPDIQVATAIIGGMNVLQTPMAELTTEDFILSVGAVDAPGGEAAFMRPGYRPLLM